METEAGEPVVMDHPDHAPGSMQGEDKKANWAVILASALGLVVVVLIAYKSW